MRLVLINNYSRKEKTEETTRNIAKCAGHEVELVDYRTTLLYEKVMDDAPDLLILSGSQHMLAKPMTRRFFEPEISIIRDASFPILGICFGHQLIGAAYGAMLTDLGRMFRGLERVKLLNDEHPLFDGLSAEIRVVESHRQALVSTPSEFELLGESASSKIEVIAHKTKTVYGVQFHPERADNLHPDGRTLIRNFLNTAKV